MVLQHRSIWIILALAIPLLILLVSLNSNPQQPIIRMLKEERKEKEQKGSSMAIIAYIPASTQYVEEANRFLFASWRYSVLHTNQKDNRYHRVDLVLFSAAENMGKFSKECTVLEVEASRKAKLMWNREEKIGRKLREQIERLNRSSCVIVQHDIDPDLDFWTSHAYLYMNSIEFLADKRYREMLMHYEKLLRTDGDVFVTPHIFNLQHDLFVVGKGSYVHMDHTRNTLKTIAKKLGLRHQGIHNLGSTWFGKPEIAIEIAEMAVWICKHFILNEFGKDVENVWSKWWRGVSSMYASELAVNHLLDSTEYVALTAKLDFESSSTELLSVNGGIPHIHCWHIIDRTIWFSKFAYHEGLYTTEKFKESDLNIAITRDYCMWIVLYYSSQIL
jgi:hypothetical protein